ncbi:unannotated protein [freshwater metagenome]|jgi:ATP-binding protein involved in chromosome partitioning
MQIPLEPAVSQGSDEGRPAAQSDLGAPAATAFHELARLVATDLLPPLEMAGCTARILEIMAAAASPKRATP